MRDDELAPEELAELLTAWLDDELDDSEQFRADRILDESPPARDLLALLTAGRDGIQGLAASDKLAPTELEGARLDRAVLGAGDRPVARRRSPSKRGRSPAPYFAVAAMIAVALIAGLGVLTRTITTDGADQVAGTREGGVDQSESPAVPEAERRAASTTAPANGVADGLFLSRIQAESPEDLQGLVELQGAASFDAPFPDSATLYSEPPSGEESLLKAAAGLEGFDDLPACLASSRAFVSPRRVDTGTWQNADAYFVSGPGSRGQPTVVVTARPRCDVLLVWP